MIMINALHVVKRWTIANAIFAVIVTRIHVNAVILLNYALVAADMMWSTVIANHLTSCLNGHKQLAVLVPRYYSQSF